MYNAYLTEATTSTVDYAESVTGLFDIAGQALNFVTANPLLTTFFVAGLVFLGIGIVNKLK